MYGSSTVGIMFYTNVLYEWSAIHDDTIWFILDPTYISIRG